MAQRPYWSGQIRVSLVSLPVNLFTATRRASQVPLHELDRKSGERIHHQNITEDGKAVDDDNIVKAYEYEKGEYVILEKEELDNVKLPSSDELELAQFIDTADIPVLHLERPYFVLPDGKKAEEIYAVLSEALRKLGKAGIGQITLRGREELCAVMAYEGGMVLETLRYSAELQDLPDDYKHVEGRKVKSDYLALAQKLIEENSGRIDLSKFHDRYHEALQELIEAKKTHRKPTYKKSAPKDTKVVDFMDALQRSLKGKSASTPSKATPKKKSSTSHRRKRA